MKIKPHAKHSLVTTLFFVEKYTGSLKTVLTFWPDGIEELQMMAVAAELLVALQYVHEVRKITI